MDRSIINFWLWSHLKKFLQISVVSGATELIDSESFYSRRASAWVRVRVITAIKTLLIKYIFHIPSGITFQEVLTRLTCDPLSASASCHLAISLPPSLSLFSPLSLSYYLCVRKICWNILTGLVSRFFLWTAVLSKTLSIHTPCCVHCGFVDLQSRRG